MRYLTSIAGIGFAVALVAATTSGVQAAKSDAPGINLLVNHYVTCLGFMANNPAAHAQYCSPGQTLPLASLSTSGGAAYVPASTSKPETPEPPNPPPHHCTPSPGCPCD